MVWETIGNKKVFFTNSHEQVLQAWYDVWNKRGRFNVLSFDNHTDLHKAFLRFAFWKFKNANSRDPSEAELNDAINQRVEQIDLSKQETISAAIHDLKHDEHIDCALRMGLVERFFLNLGRMGHGQVDARVKMFHFNPCLPNCLKAPHDDDCEVEKANIVIESRILAPRIMEIEKTIGELHKSPLVVDIDLDFFNTSTSLHPNDATSWLKILKSATAISIAREQKLVSHLSLETSGNLTADSLECELRKMIQSL